MFFCGLRFVPPMGSMEDRFSPLSVTSSRERVLLDEREQVLQSLRSWRGLDVFVHGGLEQAEVALQCLHRAEGGGAVAGGEIAILLQPIRVCGLRGFDEPGAFSSSVAMRSGLSICASSWSYWASWITVAASPPAAHSAVRSPELSMTWGFRMSGTSRVSPTPLSRR